MDNKTELDKLMYLLGQENAVEELKNTMEPHEFSQKYKNQKIQSSCRRGSRIKHEP